MFRKNIVNEKLLKEINRIKAKFFDEGFILILKGISMKSKIQSKSLIVLASILAFSIVIIVALSSCSQEKVKIGGPYPNKIAENAQISEEYKDIANTLSDSAIDEFLTITKIPRNSGNMDGIRNYILNWAKTNNKKATVDSSGCIYIDVPASTGHEKDKNIILQSHMDMVVTSIPEYTTFNKNTDAIDAVYDKEAGEIHSRDFKTSLGADDGEGIGLCLAISKNENAFEHGPIRLLFTYDEETTMEGAKSLNADVLNADYLINFDNSPCGLCATSSAGVLPIEFTKKYPCAAPTEKGASKNMTIKVDGLIGGHAGYDIAKNRNSASAFMLRYLNELKDNSIHFRLVSIDCGQAHNAIPSNFTLVLNINKKHEEQATNIFNDLCNKLKKEYSDDAEFNSDIQISEASGNFPSQQDSEKIQDVLNYLPNGLIEKDKKYPDSAAKSCNIGIVKLNDGQFYCRASYRSSDVDDIKNKLEQFPKDLKSFKIDCNISPDSVNPAWPESDSKLIKMYEQSMKDGCKITPTLTTIHAALETAPFVSKRPGIQMISIGGDVKDEHMVSETFYTKTYPASIVPVLYIMKHINELD